MTHPQNKFKNPILIAGIAVLSLGILVVAGWLLNIAFLKSIVPGATTMKFNSALGFITTALSVILIITAKTEKRVTIGRAVAVVPVLIGITTFVQYIAGQSFGIDLLFIHDGGYNYLHPYPGRMSPEAALCFIAMGTGLFTIYTKKCWLRGLNQGLFHFVTLFGFLALIGYLFNVPTFYTLAMVTSMALHSSICFLVISMAAALLNPTVGLAGMFTGKKLGNLMARKLFFQITALTIVLGYLRILSHKMQMVNVEFGIALFACSFILVALLLIWSTYKAINKSEDVKEAAEENFRLAVEAAPNALVMADGRGTITLVNVETEKIFGYTRQELIGKNVMVLIPERFREKHPENVKSFMGNPVMRYFGGSDSLWAVRKDGTEFPAEIGLNPIRTEKGTLILASIIDITERKKNELIIENQLAELMIKNKELEQFTYIASHDLQEPLRTVSNFINIIEEDHAEKIEGDIKFYLDTIGAATNRMSTLIRSLLDFSRLGRDKQLTVVNCNKMVNEVISDLGILIKISGAKIHIDTELPIINAYETELRQVFQNLVNNAVKFRKKDTTPEIHISAKKKKGRYQFEIADNGIGIDPKYHERIFQIFQRLHKDTEFEGHGIGLSNCTKIVQMHHGKIWVTSVPGEGSTFYFSIATNILPQQ